METVLKSDLNTLHTAQTLDSETKQQSGRSWLIGVIAVYSAFALGTLGMVGLTMTKTVDLVSDKYYQHEVAFQSRIDAANRAKALAEPVQWRVVETVSGKSLEITYPQSTVQQGLKGTITLFRPSALGFDKTLAVKPDANGKQIIPLEGLLRGLWTISLEWQTAGTSYYKASDVKL